MEQPRHWWSGWHVTPAGWFLGIALVVLVVLAVVDPSRGVYFALTFVVVAWAWALSQSVPSSELRGMSRADPSDLDRGGQAETEYNRTRHPALGG
jgi:cation transport ATPase